MMMVSISPQAAFSTFDPAHSAAASYHGTPDACDTKAAAKESCASNRYQHRRRVSFNLQNNDVVYLPSNRAIKQVVKAREHAQLAPAGYGQQAGIHLGGDGEPLTPTDSSCLPSDVLNPDVPITGIFMRRGSLCVLSSSPPLSVRGISPGASNANGGYSAVPTVKGVLKHTTAWEDGLGAADDRSGLSVMFALSGATRDDTEGLVPELEGDNSSVDDRAGICTEGCGVAIPVGFARRPGSGSARTKKTTKMRGSARAKKRTHRR